MACAWELVGDGRATFACIGAELDAFGALPGPVGTRLAPNDGSVGILAKTIISWLVA